MSKCRCEDIEKCDRKINKLREAIKKDDSCNQHIRATKSFLSEFQTNIYKSVESKITKQGLDSMLILHTDMDNTRSKVKSAISAEINSLCDKRDDMRHEDKKYHEERRKHHNK